MIADWKSLGNFFDHLVAHSILWNFEFYARDIPAIRYPVLDEITSLPCDDGTTFCELFFQRDQKLWKELRKKFQSLLTLGLAFQDIKLHILRCFEEYLDVNLNFFSKDRETGGLSILHFAVQILTVPSLAQQACVDQFPHALCIKIGQILQLKESELEEQLDALSMCVQMIKYIFNDESVRKSRLLTKDTSFITNLLSTLLPLHKKFKKVRRDTDHVLYESRTLTFELNVSILILAWLTELVEGYEEPEDVKLASDLIVDFIEQHIVSKTEYGPFGVKNIFYFQMPLYWLLGLFLRKLYLLQGEGFKAYQIPLSIGYLMARSLFILNEMKAGEWIRNGTDISTQLALIMSGPILGSLQYLCFIVLFSFSVGHPAPYYLITGLFYGLPLDSPMEGDLLKVLNYCLIDLFRILFGVSGLRLSVVKDRRVHVAHALATGPITFSRLRELVPSWVSEDPGFDDTIKEVAIESGTHSLTDSSKYTLQGEFSKLFNPYYWYYDEAARETAIAYMKQRFDYDKLNLLENDSFERNSRLLESTAKALSEHVESWLNSPLLETLWEDFVLLLALIKRSISNFMIKSTPKMIETFEKVLNSPACSSHYQIIANILSSTIDGMAERLSKTSVDTGKDDREIKRRSALKRQQAMAAIMKDQTLLYGEAE